ncbi:transmembrane and coiled-coil domains-containing protein 7 [Gaertneriomyces sp. JEL0708]|nr:transmembrane and coiled-coil domains-containing protein 7 [Gaertneriomyces sp. JEL0708]
MSLLKENLRTASVLTGVHKEGSPDAGTTEGTLQARLEAVSFQNDDTDSHFAETIRDKFILACLHTLEAIHASVHKEVLGSSDQKTIDTLIQIIIFWGIYPRLEHNVGLPLAQRSRYATHIVEVSAACTGNSQAFLYRIALRLITILNMDVHGIVSNMMTTRYMPDIYAALLQVGYSPNTDSQHSQEAVRTYEKLFGRLDSPSSLRALLTLLNWHPPQWLRKQCTRYLAQILMRQDGVQAVFECLLPADLSHGALDTLQLQHVARLVSAVPAQAPSADGYYAVICPQLLSMMKDASKDSVAFHAAVFIAAFMINKSLKLCKPYILHPLIAPLLSFYQEEALDGAVAVVDVHGRRIIQQDNDIELAVTLVQSFLEGAHLSQAALAGFTSIIPPIYYIYDFATQSKSGVRSLVFEVLRQFFERASSEDSIIALRQIIVGLPQMRTATLAAGDHGGVMFVEAAADDISRVHVNADRLLLLLKQIASETLMGEFFLSLLQLQTSTEHSEWGDNGFTKVLVMQLILAIMSTYGENIVKRPEQLLLFAKNMLQNGENEATSMGLALLTAIFSDADPAFLNANRAHVDDVLTILQVLTSQGESEIQRMARDVRAMLITGATSWDQVDDPPAKQKAAETFEEALKELQDDLLPVRAHGMHVLRTMIHERDQILELHLQKVISLFLEQIRNEDSFIYLNAIKGLSSLADVYPAETLSTITSRYSDDSVDIDYRLRIGEGLLQTIQRCGEVFHNYSSSILPAILCVLLDERRELRSSAQSLLACIAEVSPFSLLPVIHQVWDYVKHSLILEKSVETRRGAMMIIVFLIRGLGPRLFETVAMDVIKSIRTQIQITAENDEDELTRGHAKVALDDLETIVRTMLG